MKRCSKCGLDKPHTEFYFKPDKPGRQRANCKGCHKKQTTENYRKTPAVRRRSRLRRYGLTQEDFDTIERAQGGLCAICGQPASLVVDHDHETGRVRGLLCGNCNCALGLLKDSLENLEAAKQYLCR